MTHGKHSNMTSETRRFHYFDRASPKSATSRGAVLAEPLTANRAPPLGRTFARHVGVFDIFDGLAGPSIGAMVMLLFVGLGVSSIVDVTGGEAPLSSLAKALPIDALGFAVGALVTGFTLRRAIHKSNQVVDVFDGGLVWEMGGRERFVPWSAIASAKYVRVVKTSGVVKTYRLVLFLRDGKKISFDYHWLRDLPALATHVAAHVRFP